MAEYATFEGFYRLAGQKWANAELDWDTQTFQVNIINVTDPGGYNANRDTDDFSDAIPSGAVLGTWTALTGKTSVLGVLDADDVSIANSASGTPGHVLVCRRFVTVDSDSPLVFMINGTSGTTGASAGIRLINSPTPGSITMTGNPVVFEWSNGTDKIIRLVG